MRLSPTWVYMTFADAKPFDLLLIVYGSKAAIPLSRACRRTDPGQLDRIPSVSLVRGIHARGIRMNYETLFKAAKKKSVRAAIVGAANLGGSWRELADQHALPELIRQF